MVPQLAKLSHPARLAKPDCQPWAPSRQTPFFPSLFPHPHRGASQSPVVVEVAITIHHPSSVDAAEVFVASHSRRHLRRRHPLLPASATFVRAGFDLSSMDPGGAHATSAPPCSPDLAGAAWIQGGRDLHSLHRLCAGLRLPSSLPSATTAAPIANHPLQLPSSPWSPTSVVAAVVCAMASRRRLRCRC